MRAISKSVCLGLAVLLCIQISAAWIVAARLAFGPECSAYTFGYVNDEYTYAQRIQPLLAGAVRPNPVNGICNPNIWSPYFLEDSCRAFLSVTGLDVLVFVWGWRLLTPVLLLGLLYLLAREALPRVRPPWSVLLRMACAAAALPLLYCGYTLTTGAVPLFGCINRIPTNVEYFISALLAWLYVRFIKRPAVASACALAAAAVAMVYLRIYIAVPWAMALTMGFLYLMFTRQIQPRIWLATAATVALGLTPWAILTAHNSNLPAYRELLGRYFPNIPYMVHTEWLTHVTLAAVVAILGWRTVKFRVLLFSMAAALAVLPFICGLLRPVQQEMLMGDRFGCFYLIAVLTAGMLWLGERSLAWRGKLCMRSGLRATAVLIVVSLAGALAVIAQSIRYDFGSYLPGQTRSILADQVCFPAYRWVAANTPANALFLVDDGYDWKNIPDDPERLSLLMMAFQCNSDLFQMIGRRRRVHTEIIHGLALSNNELDDILVLQRGTFGSPVSKNSYVRALKTLHPEYVLWRKHAPVVAPGPPAEIPRGYGRILKQMSTTVYDDEFCEIWRMNYSAPAPAASVQTPVVHPQDESPRLE